jgi:hypothetical protein
MKKYYFIFAILSALSLASCTKVINVDLNTADPKYVIEGFVTKGETVHQVKITRTLNFDQTVAFPTVDNAVVVISDNAGNSETLTLVSPGIYKTSSLLGVEGRTYTITVTVDGKVFTATSYLPIEVSLDGLDVIVFPFGLDTVRAVVPNRMDQVGVTNFYQYDIFQNGEQVKGVNLQDDQFSDGVQNEQPLFGGDFIPGDTVRVIMYCIDKPVYKYLFSIDANTGSTAAPANPDSNFGKSCLGYFSARTQKEQTIIIPQ